MKYGYELVKRKNANYLQLVTVCYNHINYRKLFEKCELLSCKLYVLIPSFYEPGQETNSIVTYISMLFVRIRWERGIQNNQISTEQR
jgi:hypothetical protein